MTERLFHRLTQLGVADSGRDGELASVVTEPVGCRIIDFVIDQRFFERTQGAPVILFPAEVARVRGDGLKADHRNATGLWCARSQEALLQLLFHPQAEGRLADARWPDHENEGAAGGFLDGAPEGIADGLQAGMRNRIGAKVAEARALGCL